MASANFKIYCSRCGSHVISYHKEGSGAFLRIFLDRIIEHSEKDFKTKDDGSPKALPIICHNCGQCIGRPGKNNSRKSWRLISGSFRKKKK